MSCQPLQSNECMPVIDFISIEHGEGFCSWNSMHQQVLVLVCKAMNFTDTRRNNSANKSTNLLRAGTCTGIMSQ